MAFAKDVVRLCKTLPRDAATIELIRQVVRSAGSVGANYREANEKLSKKDFLLRLRIARKEAKETTYWLEIIQEAAPAAKEHIHILILESQELRNILSAILSKAEGHGR
ncbi:MAG: four helix bundle protein [Patescibacteria group bacterium]